MEKVTKDTYLVRFTLPGNSRLGLRPGQHLILRYMQVVGGPMSAALLCH
jgi:NAD(P)H-flavin reductase